MTRKDFELIASAFAETQPAPDASPEVVRQWKRTLAAMALRLGATNPQFDIDRFTDACYALR